MDDPSSRTTGSDYSGSAAHLGGPVGGDELPSSKLERTTSMEHQNKAQASLDVEMAKARISKTEPPSRRWIVLTTATLGALFVSLQGSALIVALPDLMRELDVSFRQKCFLALFSLTFSHSHFFPRCARFYLFRSFFHNLLDVLPFFHSV